MVFNVFLLVSMVFQDMFMVFHGFWLVSMVFQGSFMVSHGFWLVSMFFQGSFMVSWLRLSVDGTCCRNAKKMLQKYSSVVRN